MRGEGRELAEWYAVSLVASGIVGGLGLVLPQGGWFKFNPGLWMGIDAPMALLMVGAYRHLELERPLRFYGAFGLLAGAAFSGLVPLTDPSLSRLEWALAAVLIAIASGVVMLVSFGVFYQLFAGRFPWSVVVSALVLAVLSTGLTLLDLLSEFPGSLALVGCLVVLLAILNGVAIQHATGWGKMTERGNTLVARATMVAVVLGGATVLYSVLP